jgi:ATP-dependent Clp protease ATP-binding subunit ClpC
MNIFSNNLKLTLKQALRLCQAEGATEISPSHLFHALIQTKGTLAYDILSQIKKDFTTKETVSRTKNKIPLMFADSAIKLLEHAGALALKHEHSYIGTEHLLAALLDLENNMLKATGLPVDKIKKHLATILNSSSHIPNFAKIFQIHGDKFTGIASTKTKSALESFTIDLTETERQQQINPVVGREKELNQLIQILCRKDKNNPVILGEAGVGKTAIVEGLAKKILERDVPAILINKRLLNLDLGLLVAGTMYRGDFENRIKMLVAEMEESPDVILFIDEIHNLVGAGSANGTMDAANLLKPLLARGKLRCIGATTPAEYKKHIEADPALERRFQPININAPTETDAIYILTGVKENYQKFHGVTFSKDAIEAAVSLSVRYIQDKFLPDKAIDLIDEAAAKVKIRYQKSNKLFLKEKTLEEALEDIYFDKEQAIIQEAFALALKLKEQEKNIETQLKTIREELALNAKAQQLQVTKQDIVELVAERTKIPVQEISENEYKRIGKIRENLKKEIVGQETQIDEVLRVISQSQLGLGDENKPLASFLFLGGSGVGKTFLAKTIAKNLFPEEAFIQLDMSEFHENFQATKLVGAPAGYVGYREGNKFTDLVKKNPYCLILLDEIEKAHPDVIDLFLQVLEYGHLTDSIGRKINFKNAIIVMTSNVLADKINRKQIGFEKTETTVANFRPELKKHFKPEFINRIGNILLFNNLDKQTITPIVRSQLKSLGQKIKTKGFNISVQPNVFEFLSDEAVKQDSGARAVKSVITRNIEQPLLDKIICSKKKNFSVQMSKNKIVLR